MSGEAYITGLGIVSPAGVGKDRFLEALRSGRSRLGRLRGLDASEYRIGRAGEVDDEWLPASAPLAQGRGFAFSLLACREALADAGLRDSYPKDIALALGSAAGEMRVVETTMGPLEDALPLDHDHPIQGPNAVTGKLGAALGLHGPMVTFVNACAAGAEAIGVAADAIRLGRTEIAIAGGVDVLSRMVLSGFEALRAVSPTGCHPFDAERDGIQLAEIAAFVVLESGERVAADGRANTPYARVSGFGASADASHPVRPHGAGAVLAMRRALADAGLTPDAIDYVSAHGTGTVQNDPVELAALAEVFGDRAAQIPISSTKGLLGHALGASGAAEVIACALAMREGFLPPTLGWRQPMPGFEGFDIVPNTHREGVALRHIVSNAFAFGGHNAVILLSAP